MPAKYYSLAKRSGRLQPQPHSAGTTAASLVLVGSEIRWRSCHGWRSLRLVHGLGHGAWCWYKLVPMLRAASTEAGLTLDAARPAPAARMDEWRAFEDLFAAATRRRGRGARRRRLV
ncbi:hypothetical protein ZWY2020_015035 [Hordeum vulgare]|nr:hypothetical protein ZWY2020_015035 [Hordeum vulgare]